MKTLPLAAAVALVIAGAGAGAAHAAAVDVIGSSIGHDCFLFAKNGNSGYAAMEACNKALASDDLTTRNRAATHINRGVLRLRRQEYAAALADFDAAIANQPKLAEAHVDRGAALVMLGRQPEAIASIDRGLELGPDEPQAGYFIRAMARERAGDMQGAYADYKRAAEIAPKWDRPQRELRRFAVRSPK